jgi:hypothetical protein
VPLLKRSWPKAQSQRKGAKFAKETEEKNGAVKGRENYLDDFRFQDIGKCATIS